MWSRSQSETAAGGGLLNCRVVLLAIAHCLRKKQPWVADVLPSSSILVLFSSPQTTISSWRNYQIPQIHCWLAHGKPWQFEKSSNYIFSYVYLLVDWATISLFQHWVKPSKSPLSSFFLQLFVAQLGNFQIALAGCRGDCICCCLVSFDGSWLFTSRFVVFEQTLITFTPVPLLCFVPLKEKGSYVDPVIELVDLLAQLVFVAHPRS